MEVLSKGYSASFDVGTFCYPDLRCKLFADSHQAGDMPSWIEPRSVTNISLQGHFNCGLIEWKGKLLLASRLGWQRATVHLSELAADLQPIWTKPLEIFHRNGPLGIEDPRIFVHAGQLHLSVVGYEMLHHRLKIHLFVVRLSDAFEVEDVWLPRYEFRNHHEKNWQFFEHEGEMLSVYSIRPHTILRHRAGFAEKIAETPGPERVRPIHLRGGAPPVRIGDEYFHFFHTLEQRGKFYVYTGAVYTFAAKFPFEVKRIGPLSLLSCDPRETPWQGDKYVVFPCGAVLRNGQWFISYGYQDRESRIAIFDHEQIEGQLRPIESFA